MTQQNMNREQAMVGTETATPNSDTANFATGSAIPA